MRPESLFPAFAPITSLKGCGPKLAPLVEKLVGGGRVLDLWWHLPSGLIDRRYRPAIAEAEPGRIATLEITVDRHLPPRNSRMPYKVQCHDGSGRLTLVFFNGREDFLKKSLPEGETRIVSGMVELFDGQVQMTHPDRMGTLAEIEQMASIEPVYPLTAGVAARTLGKIINGALERVMELPEWLDPAWQKREGFPAWREALLTAHKPERLADIEKDTPVRRRLAYDELLANQLALLLVRRRLKRQTGRKLTGDGRLRDRLEKLLPWPLTNAQRQANAEIAADIASERRMLRLLQGDVGSGKTMVALNALLLCIESGAQGALMAPTEILARQHAETLAPYCLQLGITIALLTGRDKGKARAALLQRLADGEIDILIGTHALFQDDVVFKDLALAVIDEQHRFGVSQRLGLAAKGARDKGGVDILVMTATPIPRTLSLTAYGDMDVSKLTEKPPGRSPVDTRTIASDRYLDVVAAVTRKIQSGEQVYWVCPLVEENEQLDLAAAAERHSALKLALEPELGDGSIGLVHGKMTPSEKDAAMEAFSAGRSKLLVATTVIEVGVDVPNATLIVIEHAERFGLAQLHQLRGRVGRGGKPGACLLVYSGPLGETAKSRLKIIRETDDGFLIAEEDLRLRGAGEVLGTRQSGLPEFRTADLAAHADLLVVARDDAKLILERDPKLASDRGKALLALLYLFERDAAIQYLQSG
ncbi:ATP-dependent DNA helicase RecG [Ferrovibrio terrae]|uniref:Probable DNA 3'-5' helicase RecG n=1 Tax=Ferrovibrio terrae TaxID=2594003 RepID=A0A516H5B2_9PROT|nr:ATP-dependent DNA helicase RecG [Ferrovibrio terrae]QDO98905.1 ATP-dependent DNA helicase RecG [Ferrovibrio terrae]